MKHKFLLFVVLATMLVSTADAIVPQPVSYKQNNGAFVIKPSTTISYTDDCLRPLVVYMLDYIPFKNVSRTFKQLKGMTPSEYRQQVTLGKF